jgi:hypothetical protein
MTNRKLIIAACALFAICYACRPATAASEAEKVAALGRIEQTLNDITSSGRFSRADPALQNLAPNRALSEASPKLYLNETEIDVVRQSLPTQKLAAREGKYRVGQLLVGLAVKRIPDDLAGRVPQLSGLLYTIDPANHVDRRGRPNYSNELGRLRAGIHSAARCWSNALLPSASKTDQCECHCCGGLPFVGDHRHPRCCPVRANDRDRIAQRNGSTHGDSSCTSRQLAPTVRSISQG